MKRLFVALVLACMFAGAAQAATPEQHYRSSKSQVASLQQQLVELEMSPSIDGWAQILDEDQFVYLTAKLTATWRGYVYWRNVMFDPWAAIDYVFGPYRLGARHVANCEGGRDRVTGKPSVHAHNGQYLGMFQMGDFARRTYGHGAYALAQARAAYAYFVASGRDWSPWQCQP